MMKPKYPGQLLSKVNKSKLEVIGKEMKKNPPAILAKTRAKSGSAQAERQRVAILLSKSRKK